ncbi:MAG: hypothetical protein GY940_17450, partial [bacterium]|nr:hypothetical protein [bacterium]
LPKGTYNTLIMGSSRTHRGIHPHYIYKRLKQKAFKIAKAKIRLKFNYYFYKEYKKIAGIPKVVIYGVDYFMFKLKSNPYFMQWVGDKAAIGDSGWGYNEGPLLLVTNKNRVDDFLNDTLENWNDAASLPTAEGTGFNVIDPFVGYGKNKGEPLAATKTRGFKRFEYKGYPGIEGIYFTKLLREWEQDGAQVVLVFLPSFIGTFESNHQLNRFKKEIRRLTANYKNVSIYDYNRPEKFQLANPAYFLDGGYGKTNSHLSKTGSRVFHRLFLKDLRKHYKRVKEGSNG